MRIIRKHIILFTLIKAESQSKNHSFVRNQRLGSFPRLSFSTSMLIWTSRSELWLALSVLLLPSPHASIASSTHNLVVIMVVIFRTDFITLECATLRLTRWGQAVNIYGDPRLGRPDASPEKIQSANDILHQVLALFANAKKISEKYAPVLHTLCSYVLSIT